jgi:hypothetical protein
VRSRLGFWAAVAAIVFSLAYGVAQIAQVAGLLHDPWDRILIFAPSLALAPAFVVTMAALYAVAPPSARAPAVSAMALAIMYGAFVSTVYVTQLSVVIPHELAGDRTTYALFACCGQGQFTTGVDLLGYTMMSLSTLLAAFIFTPGGPHRWARRWLIANGLLAPFLLGQLAWPALIYVGALWLITFPVAMILLARAFAGRSDATLEIHSRNLDARVHFTEV